MRTDAVILAAQKSDNYSPVASLHHWDDDPESETYQTWVDLVAAETVMEAIRVDRPYSCQAHIELDNSDGALDSLDLNGKLIRIGLGSEDTAVPPVAHYSYLPYLWGEGWGNGLSMDAQSKDLYCYGAWEKLEGWILDVNHTTFAGDGTPSDDEIYQMTIRQMIDWVCQQAGLGKLSVGGSGGLAADISTDGYIETWAPFFIMYAGQNGKQIVKTLLELTSCLLVPFEDTFKIKLLDDTEVSVYSYSDVDETPAQQFFEEVHHEKHLFKPMKVTVLGPITYCHKLIDTLHLIASADADSKATFATLAREICCDFEYHRRNDAGYEFHPAVVAGYISADLPHKVEDGANSMSWTPAETWNAIGLFCAHFKGVSSLHPPEFNTHLASTTYHDGADTVNPVTYTPRHEHFPWPYETPYPYEDHDKIAVTPYDTEENCILLVDELAEFFNAHLVSLYHGVMDETNTGAWSLPCADLAEALAVSADIKAAHNGHLGMTACHYGHTGAEVGAAVTADDATDLESLQTLLADMKPKINAHYSMDETQMCNLINACKAGYNAHLSQADVHVVSDTWNIVTQGNASTLNGAYLLAIALLAGYNSHLLHPEAAIVAFANECKSVLNTHFIAATAHLVDDTTSTIETGPATDLPSSYALVIAAKTSLNAHYQAQGENSDTYPHADWEDGMGTYTWRDIFGLATTGAICLAIATAIVLRAEMASDKGSITTQGINALQELFDVVTIDGDVPGVCCSERIGGISWYWQPLDGLCYQVLQLGGVEYDLASNSNWMEDDLKLLQDQNDQATTATVPVAPAIVELFTDSPIANGVKRTFPYSVEAGFLYLCKVAFTNDSTEDDDFIIEALPYDSAAADVDPVPVGGFMAKRCPGGGEERSFVFYSGNTAGVKTPRVDVSITNNIGSEKNFSVTIVLIKLM